MDGGVLVPGEADVTELPRLPRLEHGFHRAAFGKDAVGILVADDLVELHEIDVVRLEMLEAFVDLGGCGFLRATVDLGHEEGLVAVAVAQGFAHANLADPSL